LEPMRESDPRWANSPAPLRKLGIWVLALVPLGMIAPDNALGESQQWHWSFLAAPSGHTRVSSVLVHPSDDATLFAWSTLIGLYVSRDAGTNWELSLYGSSLNDEGLAIDPFDPEIMWAAFGPNLHRSFDRGRTWETVATFPRLIRSIHVSSVDGNVYVAPQWYDEPTPGVYRSTDFGESWLLYPFGTSQGGLIPWDIEEDADGALYVTAEITGPSRPTPYIPPIFRSIDGGVTWTQVSPLPWHSIRMQFVRTGWLYALVEGVGLYRTQDQGTTWERMSADFAHDFLVDPNHLNRVYVGKSTFQGRDGGAFISLEEGRASIPIGLDGNPVGGLALDSNGTRVYAAIYGEGIFTTHVPLLTSAFSWIPAEPVASGEVTFLDESAGALDSWHWDFGDGHSAVERDPTHRYAAEGEYAVTLTILGCGPFRGEFDEVVHMVHVPEANRFLMLVVGAIAIGSLRELRRCRSAVHQTAARNQQHCPVARPPARRAAGFVGR